jgi:CHAD domain-containing protein
MARELAHAQKAFHDLGKALKGLPRNPAPEQVHKLRTSARRVEAIAGALPEADGEKSRRLVKSIAPLRKAAGGVRDMDVLTANIHKLGQNGSADSLARLAEHLKSVRAEEASDLRRTVNRKRKAVRHRLKKYAHGMEAVLSAEAESSNTNGHHANGVHPAEKQLTRELAEWPLLSEQNIHDFRLKVKELRYVLQLDAKADEEFVIALGSVQRRIGEWHDWQELAEIAREFLEATLDHALLAEIDEVAKQKLGRALTAANALRRQHLRVTVTHILGC